MICGNYRIKETNKKHLSLDIYHAKRVYLSVTALVDRTIIYVIRLIHIVAVSNKYKIIHKQINLIFADIERPFKD